jgi:hypothetical protein
MFCAMFYLLFIIIFYIIYCTYSKSLRLLIGWIQALLGGSSNEVLSLETNFAEFLKYAPLMSLMVFDNQFIHSHVLQLWFRQGWPLPLLDIC